MHGRDVVTSDDKKIGRVVDERNDCLIVEHGHVLKGRHAIPKTYAHVVDGEDVVRVSLTKDVFAGSPKVTDEGWDCTETLRYYGIHGEFEVDPDPEEPGRIADDGAVAERAAVQSGETPSTDTPKVRERQANAYDPAGDTANLS